MLAAEQPTVRREPVAGNVPPQDDDQLGRDGDDADGAARPVLQAALFVSGSGVGSLLADAWCGLVQFEAAPAGFGQVAVIGAQRDRFGWAQHGEVQAAKEGDETTAATCADVADSGEELAHLLRRRDHAGVDFLDTALKGALSARQAYRPGPISRQRARDQNGERERAEECRAVAAKE